MPEFSQKSLNKLSQCHPQLQQLFLEVIKEHDCTVICGYRGKAEQDEAFYKGTSRVKWPDGKHNQFPSLAVDVWPYPYPRKKNGELDSDSPMWDTFAGIVLEKASQLGIDVVWGGSWDSFKDKPHFELKANK